MNIESLVGRLRTRGSDTRSIEAKAARGGLPDSIATTLSAFANLPGGGVIILGLDEGTDFAPIRLPHLTDLKAGLASCARTALDPPVMIEIDEQTFEGERLVVAIVHETPSSAKPCRLKKSGAAYLRFWDGDYRLSDLEIQGFLANRTQPRVDIETVPGTGAGDLDHELVERFLISVRDGDHRYRRYTDDHTLLMKTGVLAASGEATVAGLVALGELPQQWFPNFVIQAAAAPIESDGADIRVGDRARFSGPIPAMLDAAIAWTRQHTRRRVRENPLTGQVVDSYDLPPVAVREVLANALVHRDLGEWALSRAVELRVTDERMTVSNPGGLFGVSIDGLGHHQLSSARNMHLLRICQFVTTADGNAVEALATGIPKILAATAAAGTLPPLFFDQGLSFTAVLRRADLQPLSPDGPLNNLTESQRRLLRVVSNNPGTAKQLAEALNITPDAVRKTLRPLLEAGLLVRTGGQGTPNTIYRRT